MSEAPCSSSPYQSLDLSNDSLDGLENEKDPVSPTERFDPWLSEHDNREISLGLLRLVALTCGIGGLAPVPYTSRALR